MVGFLFFSIYKKIIIDFNTKFMGRNRKNVLKLIIEEPKKEEVIETEPVSVDEALLTPITEELEIPMTLEEVVAQEEYISELPEEETESPVYEDDGEVDGDTEEEVNEEIDVMEEVKPRTIQSLSHSELRFFQRTGQMPK